MEIIDEIETLKKIIKDKCSISRFGDGEFYHLFNSKTSLSAGKQDCSKKISDKLKKILMSDNPKILIGISGFLANNDNIDDRYIEYTSYMKKFIRNIRLKLKKHYSDLVNKTFYSAEITRIHNLKYKYIIVHLFDQLFINNKFIFVGNKVVINLIKRKYLQKFKDIKFILVEKFNAYQDYDKILKKCLENNTSKEYVYLLSIGITATILSYDLCQKGYWAIDIGHYFELLKKI